MSRSWRSSMGVLERRVGVCRDFALLAVACCRVLNISARYTFGYFPDIAVEPPDVPMDSTPGSRLSPANTTGPA